jgi:hypothetical protein
MERNMILSFYCDDTGPYRAGTHAFQQFLDYCVAHGIAGESSVILGVEGRSMCQDTTAEEALYLAQAQRAFNCRVDTHLELMTHESLFDFQAGQARENGQHEGVWLHEPGVSVEEYEAYFAGIIAEGAKAGIRFTGLTMPGCGCDACTRRYAELRSAGITEPSPNLWQALLRLAKQGTFRSKTVPCFFDFSETGYGLHRKAHDGEYGVYDLMPNATDQFGIWENNPERVNADYYITDAGDAGLIVAHLRSGDPYCIWYMHWQGANPINGLGWAAFRTVVERIERHLQGQITWMRPSEVTDHYHAAGGWDFPIGE